MKAHTLDEIPHIQIFVIMMRVYQIVWYTERRHHGEDPMHAQA